MQIVKRAEAVAKGLTRYFTGKPCKHGHVSERYTEKGTCIACAHIAGRKWDVANRDKRVAAVQRWIANHPEQARQIRTKVYNKIRAAHPEHIVAKALIARLRRKLGTRREKSTFEALGYSAADLRAHMESLFQPGMSWDNHGEWHIDHIKPVAQCIAEGETNPAIINALSNLQPLWATDNLRKNRYRRAN